MSVRLTLASLLLLPSFFASPPGRERLAMTMLAPVVVVRAPAAGSVRASTDAVARGIDVSHYQGAIDWAAVEGEGIGFAFVKATEGGTFVDPAFARNWAALGRTGMARGAYHRFRPRVDGAAQARHFLAVAPVAEGDLPPVLDVEATDGVSDAALIRGVRTWLREVERATGKRPIVYTKPGFRRAHLGRALNDYPLWTAEYGVDAPSAERWTLWQHSEHGHVAGIAKEVDLDRFNGPRQALLALSGPGGGAARLAER